MNNQTDITTPSVLRSAAAVAALLIAILALSVGASSAEAAVFCVNKNPCPLGGIAKPTIDEALDTAAANGVADNVLVGANGGTPYAETLNYIDSEPVHLIGEGVGATVIAPAGPSLPGVRVLNPSSTIEDLTIRVRDADSVTGLSLDGTASGIEVVHEGTPLANLTGVSAEPGAVLEDSSVSIDGFTAIRVPAAGDTTVRDSSVRSRGVGITAHIAGADVSVSRSTIRSGRSSIETGQTGSSLTIDNSVLRPGSGFAGGDGAISALSGANVIARHLTIVGSDVGAAIVASADTTSTSVVLRDSVISNFAFALRCFGENGFVTTLGVTYSNWTDPNQLEAAGQCDATFGAGNTAHDPQFVGGLVENFRLRAASQLIDAADPASPLTVDRDNALRPVDGDETAGARADIGAFEYQRRAPVASASGPATASVGQQAAFTAAGTSDPDDGDELALSWDFGDGGSATGFAPTHVFAGPGTYTVTLTATDPLGLSDTATVQVEVPAAPSPSAATPETTISQGPSKKQLRKRKASLAFVSTDPAATFECSLDGAAFAACGSPQSYRRLKRGRHVFAVRAVGMGGTDATPAEAAFKVKKRRR